MKEKEFKKLLNKQKNLSIKIGKLKMKIEKIEKEREVIESQIYGACCEADWEQDYRDNLKEEGLI